VLELKFGLDNGQGRTMSQVSQIVGISVDQAYNVENRALQKLRNRAETAALHDYLT